MNRFRKLGFIDYAGAVEGGLRVHSALPNVVLHDCRARATGLLRVHSPFLQEWLPKCGNPGNQW
jgi:hypothetical protein